jgi:hypothetical protein
VLGLEFRVRVERVSVGVKPWVARAYCNFLLCLHIASQSGLKRVEHWAGFCLRDRRRQRAESRVRVEVRVGCPSSV